MRIVGSLLPAIVSLLVNKLYYFHQKNSENN